MPIARPAVAVADSRHLWACPPSLRRAHAKSCETHSIARPLPRSPAGIGSHFAPPCIRSKVPCDMPLQTEEKAFSEYGLCIPTSFDAVFLLSAHVEVQQRRNRSSDALRPDECTGASNSDLPGIESGTRLGVPLPNAWPFLFHRQSLVPVVLPSRTTRCDIL